MIRDLEPPRRLCDFEITNQKSRIENEAARTSGPFQVIGAPRRLDRYTAPDENSDLVTAGALGWLERADAWPAIRQEECPGRGTKNTYSSVQIGADRVGSPTWRGRQAGPGRRGHQESGLRDQGRPRPK